MIAQVIHDELAASRAGVLATVMRVLAGLGPEPLAQEQALRDVELMGLVMHGLPPRNAAEWQRARELFHEDALTEFQRWDSLAARAKAQRRPAVAGDAVHTEGGERATWGSGSGG